MSQAYQKFAKKRDQGKKKVVLQKYNLHKISFDDQDLSERSDIPNILLDSQSEVQSPVKIQKEKKKEVNIVKQESLQQLQKSSSYSNSPQRENEAKPKYYKDQYGDEQNVQQYMEQQVAEAQDQIIAPHTSLSLLQSLKLNLGEYLFYNVYPMKKTIYINNNNEEENQVNRRDFQIKNKSQQRQISYYDNSIRASSTLFVGVILLRNIFTYFYIYSWIAIIILQGIAQNVLLNGPIQYGTQKIVTIILIIIAVFIQFIADILSVRKRRAWEENRNSYRVYHHNGRMAEWVNIKAHQIKSGHVYKVNPSQSIPTDCIPLHSEHSLIQIKQNHLISQLVEHPSEIVLKQALFKGDNISLPLSGYLNYEISSPEYSEFQIVGKLNLEEPQKISLPISMSNIILRGSINWSDAQVVCLALQTGIDSLMIKSVQYPYQHRKSNEQKITAKAKKISDETSFEIKDHQSTFIGLPIEKKIQSIVIAFIFLYLMMTGIGILTSFLYRSTKPNQFYLSQSSIAIWKIVIYHLTNFIIFIPVLLIPMTKLFVMISGSLTQINASKRSIELIPESVNHRRAHSLSGSNQSQKNQQLLDNRKIIFPACIKDHNILPELCDVDTIITTIDVFRDQAAFTLHSIKVKEISHNFMTTSLENEIYSIEDVQLIKYFMSVALLSTTKNDFQQQVHYEAGIEFAAKKYLDLKKNKNALGQTLVNGEQFKVKNLFCIKPTYQYPFKVVFLQPITEQADENEKVLVLVRGNPKILLDKTYGKQIKLTEQSRKLSEEKGFYVELISKTTLSLGDCLEIQKAYNSNNIEMNFFYKNLDKYISKIEPMGLLVFTNNFYKKKIGQSVKNPVLNKSIINQHHYEKSETYSSDVYTSHNLPNIIILTPVSLSSQPQFESIHAITNLLINPSLFNYNLSEVSDKIIHEKPNNIEKMIDQLDEEGVLVWDGWDQKDISYTVDILQKYGKKIMLYLQKDEYMFLMKSTDYTVTGYKHGYDIDKYSDASLSSRSSISFLYLTQLICYDSMVIKQGLYNILFTQVSKFIFYLIIQFVNFYLTRGSGLTVIRSQLYFVVEIVLLFDVFFHLNWKDSMRAETFNKKDYFIGQLSKNIIQSICQAIFIVLICVYSLESPTNSSGTSNSYHTTYFIIVFTFLHVLIFEKIFNLFTMSFSIYRGITIIVQLIVLYIGFIVISATDQYGYKGILQNSLQGKSLLTGICYIWICLTVSGIKVLFKLMKSKKLKKGEKINKNY